MVDLEPLDQDDRDLVHDLVTRHVAATGSHLGARLLLDWDTAWPRFVKIMPRDYKRAIAATWPLAEVSAHG
jgi:glutamate synthase (NADPH/NADH) large chain